MHPKYTPARCCHIEYGLLTLLPNYVPTAEESSMGVFTHSEKESSKKAAHINRKKAKAVALCLDIAGGQGPARIGLTNNYVYDLNYQVYDCEEVGVSGSYLQNVCTADGPPDHSCTELLLQLQTPTRTRTARRSGGSPSRAAGSASPCLSPPPRSPLATASSASTRNGTRRRPSPRWPSPSSQSRRICWSAMSIRRRW